MLILTWKTTEREGLLLFGPCLLVGAALRSRTHVSTGCYLVLSLKDILRRAMLWKLAKNPLLTGNQRGKKMNELDYIKI